MNHKLLIVSLLTVALLPLAGVQAQKSESAGSIHIVGKIVMAGGQLPWDPVPIVIHCDGQTRAYSFADRNGQFNLEPSPRESAAAESSHAPRRVNPAEFDGCKVSAVLAGFQSTTVTIKSGSNPDIGAITLSRDAQAAGSVVSATLATAPPEALKELDKAQADESNKSLGSAKKHLQKAISLDPQLAEAWYHLGKLQEKDKPQEALEAFKKAAAADPKYIPPYERIAALEAVQQKWQDVADAANHALQLYPAGTPQIWYFSAVGNYNIDASGQAETSALNALAMDPNHLVAPKAEDQLAVILARRGAYAEALEHLRHCLTYIHSGADADLIKLQIAQLEKVLPSNGK